MKIFISGGAGYIGTTLVPYLLEQGHKVTVLDRFYFGRESLESRIPVEKKSNLDLIRDDIRYFDGNLLEGFDAVVDMAALSNDPAGELDRWKTFEINYLGRSRVARLAKEAKVKRYLLTSCYDTKTRAFTPDGFKHSTQLRENDLVFSLNPKTEEIELKPITKVFRYPYEGTMIHFRSRRTDILVTPNHRMLIRAPSTVTKGRRGSKKRLVFEEANDVAKRSYFSLPKGTWTQGIESPILNVGPIEFATEDIFYLTGIYIGGGLGRAHQLHESLYDKSPRLVLARATNGKFASAVNAIPTCADKFYHHIYMPVPETDSARPRIESILQKYKIKYWKSRINLGFTSESLLRFFKDCGENSHNKKIPRWMLKYSGKYLQSLYGGIMDSDGDKGHRRVLTTVSYDLVETFSELCIKLGFFPHTSYRRSENSVKGRKVTSGVYQVTAGFREPSLGYNFGDNVMKEEYYKGEIWCCSVQDNQNLLIERNGTLAFCGNSCSIYGFQDGMLTEESKTNPLTAYARANQRAETDNLLLGDADFTSTAVRFATIYGLSGRMRFDLAINGMTLGAFKNGKIPIMRDGTQWRPFLHVKDAARAVLKILETDPAKINREIFNIGSEAQNYQIRDLAQIVANSMTKRPSIEWYGDPDTRSYRVSFDKARKILGYETKYSAAEAVKEIESALRSGSVSDTPMTKTVEWYKHLLAQGQDSNEVVLRGSII